jgi:Na+/citrate or Na+/malate symporter
MKDSKEIQARVDKVYNAIVNEEKVFNRSLTKTVLLYLFIALLLIGNIIFLKVKILNEATPKNMAIVINTQIKDIKY